MNYITSKSDRTIFYTQHYHNVTQKRKKEQVSTKSLTEAAAVTDRQTGATRTPSVSWGSQARGLSEATPPSSREDRRAAAS